MGSQVENTLTIALILRALCGKSVDKHTAKLWIKMWKIQQVFCDHNLRNWLLFDPFCQPTISAAENKLKKNIFSSINAALIRSKRQFCRNK
jgi:hypothetical protein